MLHNVKLLWITMLKTFKLSVLMQTWLDVKDAEIIIQQIKLTKNTFVADAKKFQKVKNSLDIYEYDHKQI